jgi:hypothetical protein
MLNGSNVEKDCVEIYKGCNINKNKSRKRKRVNIGLI